MGRWGAAGIVIAAALLVLWSIVGERSGDPFPVGSRLPPLAVKTSTGGIVLGSDSNLARMILLYDRRCGHCIRELNMLEDHVDDFKGFRVVLLEIMENDGSAPETASWPRLHNSKSTQFGSIERGTIRPVLGRLIVPLILVYDRQGILRERIEGVSTIGRILLAVGKI